MLIPNICRAKVNNSIYKWNESRTFKNHQTMFGVVWWFAREWWCDRVLQATPPGVHPSWQLGRPVWWNHRCSWSIFKCSMVWRCMKKHEAWNGWESQMLTHHDPHVGKIMIGTCDLWIGGAAKIPWAGGHSSHPCPQRSTVPLISSVHTDKNKIEQDQHSQHRGKSDRTRSWNQLSPENDLTVAQVPRLHLQIPWCNQHTVTSLLV